MLIHRDLSIKRMKGINPCLYDAVLQASESVDIFVGDHGGLRTPEEQEELIRRGVSWTRRSKHLTGDAVDLVAYDRERRTPIWGRGAYEEIKDAMRAACRSNLVWGGSWKQADLGHFEVAGCAVKSTPVTYRWQDYAYATPSSISIGATYFPRS